MKSVFKVILTWDELESYFYFDGFPPREVVLKTIKERVINEESNWYYSKLTKAVEIYWPSEFLSDVREISKNIYIDKENTLQSEVVLDINKYDLIEVENDSKK